VTLNKTPKTKDSHSFPEAIKAIMRGKKVTRFEWDDTKLYGFLNKDTLSLHKADGNNYQWIVTDGDLFAKDWMIVE